MPYDLANALPPGAQHRARGGRDSASGAFKLRAGALNHGLALRDSLLVAADSVLSALFATMPDVEWAMVRRAHAIAQELTRRYPDDFESWYTLGEAHYHLGTPVHSSPRQALEAFDRAIESDSSFAPVAAVLPTRRGESSLTMGTVASRYCRPERPPDGGRSRLPGDGGTTDLP